MRPCAGRLGLIWTLLCSAAVAAVNPPRATIGRTPGALAVRSDAATSWSLVAAGDRLPDQCWLESGLSRASRVELPGGVLSLAPGTRLRLDEPARRIVLESGRIFVSVSPASSRPWSVTAEGMTMTLALNSATEWTVEPGKQAVLCVTQGTVSPATAGKPAPPLETQTEWRWSAAEKTLVSESLSAEAKARIAAWTRPQAASGQGQLLVRDAQSESPVRLNVARYHVHVVLQAPVALVQIDQSFFNPLSRQEEGTFVFSLPPQASVSRFAMYVTPRSLIEGELIERSRAAGIYQSIVDRQRDPAILEEIGANLFRMRVFPIPARDSKRILLDYTVPLETTDGMCRFQLPLFSDLQSIWDFRLSGVIRGATRSESVNSPSHPGLAFQTRADGAIQFDLRKDDYQPRSDFQVAFAVPAADQPKLSSYRAEALPIPSAAQGGNAEEADRDEWRTAPATYFAVSLPPEPVPAAAPPPADVLILADTSGSMRRAELLRQTVRAIVSHLPASDRFRLVGADLNLRALHEGWLTPGSREARAALASLDREFSLGDTDLENCLLSAVRQFDGRPPRRRLVIYVGDAEPGEPASHGNFFQDQEPLREHIRKAGVSLTAVIVRRSAEGWQHWRTLTQEVGSQAFDVAGKASDQGQLLTWLLAGLPEPAKILDVKIDGVAPDDLFYPSACRPGQTIHVLGRARGTIRQVRLSWTKVAAGKPQAQSWTIPVDPKQDDVFVGRLWAQERLERLKAEKPAATAAQEVLQRRIVALSREWSLLSPHTAFLVLENEAQYADYKIDRSQRRRYWRPDDGLRQRAPSESGLEAAKAAEETSRKRIAGQRWEMDRQRWEATKEAVRAALKAGDPAQAVRLLTESRSAAAKESAEYAALRSAALRALAIQTAPRRLGSYRHWFDPSAPIFQGFRSPDLGQLLHGAPEVNSDFERRHPYARQLLTSVSLRWPKAGRLRPTLGNLVDELRQATGKNVMLDRKALSTAGIEEWSESTLYATGRISWRNYARAVLRQFDLALLEQPHRLLITTPEKAEYQLTTEVVPVADLLFTDRTAEPSLLIDPYSDCDEAAAQRLREKLKQPINVHFVEAPLEQVLLHVAQQLNDNLVLDGKALSEVGLPVNQPVTADWKGVPAKESLQWLLEPLDLTYLVRGEAIEVTTPEKADEHLTVRVHSGRGILYEPAMSSAARGGGMGMAGAMGMGGFGGGMGMVGGGMAMGGLGGGMGSAAPAGTATARDRSGVSSGGAPEDDSGLEEEDEVENPENGVGGGVGGATRLAFGGGGGAAMADFDSLTDRITSTIRPTTWDAVGGPGNIAVFEPTLDYVFAQTEDVHEELAQLFERLRRLPPVADSRGTPKPVEVAPATTREEAAGRLPDLIDLITSTIHPTTWDSTGGPCSIAPDEARLALIINATETQHDGVYRLLTLLRRSRYAALRRDRPWESPRPLRQETSDAAPAPGAGVQPTAEELKLLAVRRVPAKGAWKWRRLVIHPESLQTIALRCAGGRWEVQWPEGVARIEGDRALVAWPGRALAERGDSAEPARRSLDAWLPWLPHRSNEELAQRFHVQAVPLQPNRADVVGLRLTPRGLSDCPDTYLLAFFSAKTGQPERWDAYLGGERTSQLLFHDAVTGPTGPRGRTVTLIDGTGETTLARWEAIEWKAPTGPIPDPAAGWDGCLELAGTGDRGTRDPELRQALQSIGKRNWTAAATQLETAIKRHPRQPLLPLLRAWCYEQDPHVANRNDILAGLRDVAASPATALTRFIAEKNLTWLSPRECYDVLLSKPEPDRSAEDWEILARAALENRLPQDALSCIDKALAAPGEDDAFYARQRLRVEILFRLKRSEEAPAATRKNAPSRSVTPGELVSLGEMLAKWGHKDMADTAFKLALKSPVLPPAARLQLLWRQAAVHVGLARWLCLMAVVEATADNPVEHERAMAAVLDELRKPEQASAAGTLASKTLDAEFRTRLLLCQAELLASPSAAGNVLWEVHRSATIPADQLGWACTTWNEAGQHARTIEVLEARLRAGDVLPQSVLGYLAEAYHLAGRPADADRANTGYERATLHDESPSLRGRQPSRRRGGDGGIGMF